MRDKRQAYLLAAGSGRRSGGPKAWRLHDGRALLERQIDFLLARFAPQAVTVSIQEGWRKRCRAINPAVRWIIEDPRQSALAALQTLLRACPQRGWAFLYHVDMPVWEHALFDLLAEAASKHVDAVIPAYGGRKGHPVLLSPGLGQEILSLDPSQNRLDHWLRTRKVGLVDVPYACVLENWNVNPRRERLAR